MIKKMISKRKKLMFSILFLMLTLRINTVTAQTDTSIENKFFNLCFKEHLLKSRFHVLNTNTVVELAVERNGAIRTNQNEERISIIIPATLYWEEKSMAKKQTLNPSGIRSTRQCGIELECILDVTALDGEKAQFFWVVESVNFPVISLQDCDFDLKNYLLPKLNDELQDQATQFFDLLKQASSYFKVTSTQFASDRQNKPYTDE